MSGKIYHIKDLGSLRIHPDTERFDTEYQEQQVTRVRSIFALSSNPFQEILPRRSPSKRFPHNQDYIRRSNRPRKEFSMPLPYISKDQGTIASFLPAINSPKISKIEGKNNHPYLKKHFLVKTENRHLDLTGILTKIYRKLS